MAKKKETSEDIVRIKKALDEKTLVIGLEKTLSALKVGKMGEVFFAVNCPQDVKDDIAHYCKLQGKEAVELAITNEELGIACKKPFSISVVGISKK
ncbi:MAG: ribosomal L7Ae/L30e/S12e/Gadd45 family protein [Candidatus Woesearchaeota archaeon]